MTKDTINPEMTVEMQRLCLDRVIPGLMATDTDSAYFNFLGVFLEEETTVTTTQFQSWLRE